MIEKIEKYLDEAGCLRKYRGYSVLSEVIAIDIEEPLLSCTDLFRRYVSLFPVAGGKRRRIDDRWLRAYKNARYCFLCSEKSTAFDGVYSFIKQVSSSVRRDFAREI